MKLLVYNLLKFTVFGIMMYLVLLITAGATLPDGWKNNLFVTTPGKTSTYTRLKEIDTTKSADILIIGTSHAFMDYDPRIFKQHNWRVVILATHGQSFIQTELLLKRYITRLKPKFIIFDIYPFEFSSDGVESGVDIMSNTSLKKDIIEMAFKLNNVKVYNTLIYSMFKHAFAFGKAYEDPKVNKFGTYIKGGFIENYSKYKIVQPIVNGTYEIRSDQLIAFKNVINLLKQQKVTYVLVQAPLTRQKYFSINNNAATDSMLVKYGSYYNFNKIISIPITGFKDEDHLNQYGVNAFDARLISILSDTIDKACKKANTTPTLN